MALAIVMACAAVAACGEVPESFTCRANTKVPAVVGVPLIVPVRDRLNPAGNCPDTTLQVYGGVPPLAVRLALYPVPTVPPESEPVVSAIGVAAVLAAGLGLGTGLGAAVEVGLVALVPHPI